MKPQTQIRCLPSMSMLRIGPPVLLSLGGTTLAPFNTATEQKPIFYFRILSLSLYRETNTVAWMNGVLIGHIFGTGGRCR